MSEKKSVLTENWGEIGIWNKSFKRLIAMLVSYMWRVVRLERKSFSLVGFLGEVCVVYSVVCNAARRRFSVLRATMLSVMIRRLAICCFGMPICSGAMGAPWPVITDVRVSILSSTTAEYYVTGQVMEVPIHDDSCMGLVGSSTCKISYGHKHYTSKDHKGWLWNGTYVKRVMEGERPSETAVKMFEDYGTMKIWHSGVDNGGECVGYVVGPDQEGSWSGSSIRMVVPCITLPEPDQWCSITSPELVLDFGTVTLRNGIGSRASDNVNIECTAGMRVRLSLVSADAGVSLNGNAGRVEITRGLGEMELAGGLSTVPIEGEIRTLNSFGELYGSSVLVIEPI